MMIASVGEDMAELTQLGKVIIDLQKVIKDADFGEDGLFS